MGDEIHLVFYTAYRLLGELLILWIIKSHWREKGINLYHPIYNHLLVWVSKQFSVNIRIKFMVTFQKVFPRNKLKRFNVFVIYFHWIGRWIKFLYWKKFWKFWNFCFSSVFVVKLKSLEEWYLRSVGSDFVFPVIGN